MFSRVVKSATMRTLLSLAVSRNWHVQKLDVENTFLYSHLSKTVYMFHPHGFVNPNKPNYVCHLKHSLYGLKQAPHAWFQQLRVMLLSSVFSITRPTPPYLCFIVVRILLIFYFM